MTQAILSDHDYPNADQYAVDAETSREAIQLVLSGDPEKARLIRKGSEAT